MEARNRAIAANRSRNSSPAPHANGHRRDRSADGRERTRFPISTSSPINERKPVRSSLEVPGSAALDGSMQAQQQQAPTSNGAVPSSIPEHPARAESPPPPSSSQQNEDMQNGTPSTGLPEKKDSLTRSSRFPMRKHGPAGSRGPVAGDRSSLASSDGEKVGVQLSDPPMDD